MRGKTVKEAARELTKAGKSKQEVKELKLFKSFSGNRPSNTLVLKKADPYTLGMLVAMYEHKVLFRALSGTLILMTRWGLNWASRWL